MRLSLTLPVGDPRRAAGTFAAVEAAGFDGGFTFESSHDPFLPLALAAGSTQQLRLGTAVAIGFARNPMILANIGYDLQVLTEGRFVLGLGSQIKPHIERRFSETWSRPAARMAEMVRAVRAIWSTWQDGARLDFEGEFYRHTLMTPAFDPGPNPFGPPPIMLGGFGPKMIEVAGEVADGLCIHPFTSRRAMEEHVLPALDRGAARGGRSRAALEVLWVVIVASWSTDEGRAAALMAAKAQLAFYGSTPAYRGVLELHGAGDLHPELHRLSKQGDWAAMADAFPDDLAAQIAVVGRHDEIADQLADRVAGITDSVGIVNHAMPDPAGFADIVAGIRARGEG
jgi:probable F420-dependent oxidoreductase